MKPDHALPGRIYSGHNAPVVSPSSAR